MSCQPLLLQIAPNQTIRIICPNNLLSFLVFGQVFCLEMSRLLLVGLHVKRLVDAVRIGLKLQVVHVLPAPQYPAVVAE